MRIDDALAANRANWDERVPTHLRAYDVEGFVADRLRISDVVLDDLELRAPRLPGGSVAGRTLVHLMCHIGLDTLSSARLGASVTGVDFSPAAIGAARVIASRCAVPARFVESDVERAASVCVNRFDIVYTSVGVLPWLPNLGRWASVVAALLKPDGLFYLRDAHPLVGALDYDRDDGELVLRRPYFAAESPVRFDHGTTYADGELRLENSTTYEWQHSVSEIVQPLLSAGLAITAFSEHRTIPWAALPQLVPTA